MIAAEAQEGYAWGHRAFKIKVGRGARHMELTAGLQRDIAVVHAVRAAVGENATLMMDANNGYNLNLAKQLLRATAGGRHLLARRGIPRGRGALRRPSSLAAV